MNKWSPERAEAIRQFIDEYFMENRKSPTVRDIAAGTGISKTSVQRYLTDMKEHGEIEYNGRRSIGTNLSRNMFETTPAIRYDSTVSCGLPSEPNVEEADIIPLTTALADIAVRKNNKKLKFCYNKDQLEQIECLVKSASENAELKIETKGTKLISFKVLDTLNQRVIFTGLFI